MDHVASTRLDANLRTAIDPEEGTWMEQDVTDCLELQDELPMLRMLIGRRGIGLA